MKISLAFLVCTLLVMLTCDQTDAWWGGGSSSRGSSGSSRSSARRTVNNAVNKVKEAGKFVAGAAKGAVEMGKAYKDMRDANYKNSDKYFHARGNSDAAKHGPGGKWAAETISNARESIQKAFGGSPADSAADQEANKWGRNGGDPNKYRPKGLPEKYRK